MGASESSIGGIPEGADGSIDFNDGPFSPSNWCSSTPPWRHTNTNLEYSLSNSAVSKGSNWMNERDAYEGDLVLWHRNKRRNLQRRTKLLRVRHLQYSLFGKKANFGSFYGQFYAPFPSIVEELDHDGSKCTKTSTDSYNTSYEYLFATLFPQDSLWNAYTTRIVSAVNLFMTSITPQGGGLPETCLA